jgi:hypothetical protein
MGETRGMSQCASHPRLEPIHGRDDIVLFRHGSRKDETGLAVTRGKRYASGVITPIRMA